MDSTLSCPGSIPAEPYSIYMYMYMYLGVLCCFALFVCLTLLTSFFLPSHLSFKNMYICTYTYFGYDFSQSLFPIVLQ